MPIKAFNELVKVDLSGKTSQKPIKKKMADGTYKEVGKLDYLNWADCLAALYEHGADSVRYGNIRSKDDHPLFLINNGIPFVRVFVEVDDDRRELDFLVIDGSKDIKMEFITQSDVHNASQRAFVKCVAINWGLGLSLWRKEEKKLDETRTPEDDIHFHNAIAIKRRIEQLVTAKLQNGLTMDDIYNLCGSERKYNILLSALVSSVVFEKKLREL